MSCIQARVSRARLRWNWGDSFPAISAHHLPSPPILSFLRVKLPDGKLGSSHKRQKGWERNDFPGFKTIFWLRPVFLLVAKMCSTSILNMPTRRRSRVRMTLCVCVCVFSMARIKNANTNRNVRINTRGDVYATRRSCVLCSLRSSCDRGYTQAIVLTLSMNQLDIRCKLRESVVRKCCPLTSHWRGQM